MPPRPRITPAQRVALRAIASALAVQHQPGSGIASQQVAHATIVTQLRALGLDSGTARVLADRSQAYDASPSTPLSPAMRMAHGQNPDTRAAYLVAAAKRLAEKHGLDRLDQQSRERRYLAQHLTAQTQREQAALKVDAAAAAYGQKLRWVSREDDRTTPACRVAHGKTFRADKPPAIGLPGTLHGGACRCIPGPVTNPRAPRLSTATGGAVTEYSRLDPHAVVIELARAARCRTIELAEPKKTAAGDEVTKSGLVYNAKTKTFRPATDAEKNSGKKDDFKARHPRAPAGDPTGGQFVPVGQARDENAKKAQGDKGAQGDYKELLVGKGGPADKKKGLRTLNDKRLQALSRVLYSFKTSDPRVVAARTLVAGELARRGQDVKKYGALGGGPKPKRQRVALSRTAPPEIVLSANTARYSTTSTPLGKGDLFNTPGVSLPHYIRNIARSIRADSGRTLSVSIALAIGAVKRWSRGGGDVSPEVRAAAVKAVAQWEAAKARARATPNKRDLARHAGDAAELARYVRTPAGAKRYRLPIGSPLGKGRGPSPSGSRLADAISRMDGLKASREHARDLSDDDLAAVDDELSRRAAALSKPGQLNRQQRAVREEMARRTGKTAGAPAPSSKKTTLTRSPTQTTERPPAQATANKRDGVSGQQQPTSGTAPSKPSKPPKAAGSGPALTDKQARQLIRAMQSQAPKEPGLLAKLTEVIRRYLAQRRASTALSVVDPHRSSVELAVAVRNALDGPRTTRTSTAKGAVRMAGQNPFKGNQAPPFGKGTAPARSGAVPAAPVTPDGKPNPFTKKTPPATPTAAGPAKIKQLVAAYSTVPDAQRDAYRKKVIAAAREAGAMALIPDAWLKGKPGIPAGAGGNPAAGRGAS